MKTSIKIFLICQVLYFSSASCGNVEKRNDKVIKIVVDTTLLKYFRNLSSYSIDSLQYNRLSRLLYENDLEKIYLEVPIPLKNKLLGTTESNNIWIYQMGGIIIDSNRIGIITFEEKTLESDPIYDTMGIYFYLFNTNGFKLNKVRLLGFNCLPSAFPLYSCKSQVMLNNEGIEITLEEKWLPIRFYSRGDSAIVGYTKDSQQIYSGTKRISKLVDITNSGKLSLELISENSVKLYYIYKPGINPELVEYLE